MTSNSILESSEIWLLPETLREVVYKWRLEKNPESGPCIYSGLHIRTKENVKIEVVVNNAAPYNLFLSRACVPSKPLNQSLEEILQEMSQSKNNKNNKKRKQPDTTSKEAEAGMEIADDATIIQYAEDELNDVMVKVKEIRLKDIASLVKERLLKENKVIRRDNLLNHTIREFMKMLQLQHNSGSWSPVEKKDRKGKEIAITEWLRV